MGQRIKSQDNGHRSNNAECQALTKMIMKLFDLWQLSTKEQLELLGLASGARATLSRYRKKFSPLGMDEIF